MKNTILQRYYRILGAFARRYIQKTKPYIVGINGSVGKTSCRMIVAQTLKTVLPNVEIYTSPKNFNGELGMSLSVFRIEEYSPSVMSLIRILRKAFMQTYFRSRKKNQHTGQNSGQNSGQNTPSTTPQVLLLEYGIDHPGEMEFLLRIVKPDCAIHTQIDAVHSEQFGNPENIAKEEFLLETHAKDIVFLNMDDPYLTSVLDEIVCDKITYSALGKSQDTTIQIQEKQLETGDIVGLQRGIVSINNKKDFDITIPLLGKYHLAYAGVGMCLADILSYKFFQKGVDQEQLHKITTSNQPEKSQSESVALDVHLQPGRRSVFNGIYNSIIIDSTYNASPRSVMSILEETTARRNNTHPTRKLIFILGDMRELGTQEQKEHETIAQFLQKYDARVFLVGKAMKQFVMPYLQKNGDGRLLGVEHFGTFEKIGKHLQNFLLQNNDDKFILVFKGSQNTIFLEEAIKYVLKNKEDEQHLTRQGNWWSAKKKSFLESFSKRPLA